MDVLKASNIPTLAPCPVAMSSGAASLAVLAAVADAVVPTNATHGGIDASTAPIKKVASDQFFVVGRVGPLWEQLEAQTNVVQVHDASLQQLQPAAASGAPSAPCQPCGLGFSGAVGVPTEDCRNHLVTTVDGSYDAGGYRWQRAMPLCTRRRAPVAERDHQTTPNVQRRQWDARRCAALRWCWSLRAI